jgi:hypothetical protein
MSEIQGRKNMFENFSAEMEFHKVVTMTLQASDMSMCRLVVPVFG